MGVDRLSGMLRRARFPGPGGAAAGKTTPSKNKKGLRDRTDRIVYLEPKWLR